MIPPWWQKANKTKEPLDESESGEWKVGLKLNIQKTKIMETGPITSCQIDVETVETVTDFIFLLLLLLSHFSRVWLCVTPWTAAYQASPSMDFPGKSTGWGAIAFSETLSYWAPKSLQMVTAGMELKAAYFLERKLWQI